jgi:transposase
MVWCLLVYRLAECRLRARLVETAQTLPDHGQKPTAHPTLRWVFPCVEGIEQLPIHTSSSSRTRVLRLQAVHCLIFSLLGPRSETMYLSSS